MREEQFREAQADAAYNHHLLLEHLQAEGQIAAEQAEQEALLDSYCSACKGRLKHWQYSVQVAEAAAAYKEVSKEGDEAGEALFGETEDEADDNAASPRSAGIDKALLRRGPAAPTTRQKTSPAQPRPHPAGNMGEDFHHSAKAPPAGNETEDIAGSVEVPPRCQRGRATQKMRKSRT